MAGRGLAWLGAAWRGEAGFIRRVLSDEERTGRSRSAIGGGTGVHPQRKELRTADLHLKARGAAASLEPGRRSGGDCCAGRGRTALLPRRSSHLRTC